MEGIGFELFGLSIGGIRFRVLLFPLKIDKQKGDAPGIQIPTGGPALNVLLVNLIYP